MPETPSNLHKVRTRFAWLPVSRWEREPDDTRFFRIRGWYWLREVVEVKVGVVPEWTAFAHYNED